MKGRLLSNVTMHPLLAFLHPMPVTCADLNSFVSDLVDPMSPCAAAETTHVFCLFDTDALLAGADDGLPQSSLAHAFLDALEAFCARVRDKTVVVTTFCVGADRVFNFADVLIAASPKLLETELNARLVGIAKARANLLILDVEPLFKRYGEEALISPSFWYAGRIRYTNLMFRCLAERITMALGAFSGKAKKVLVLDLDDTLWGGTLDALGPLGVELAEDGRGRCYRDFQRALKAVKTTGVLLTICSKNDITAVDEIFERNSMMILQREDFVCIHADWDQKPEGIVDIANTLGLGLDSFVFIDNSPVERGIVSSSLPDVVVPTFPQRVELLPTWFVRDVVHPYFGRYHITVEDSAKTQQYEAMTARKQQAVHVDLASFLTDLNIEYRVEVDSPERVVRASQMTQKTNQFNVTNRRYEIPDIVRFTESREHSVIALNYRDRFGDEGIVGLTILDFSAGKIDTLLMSCRVIGRRVEDRLLKEALDLFRKHGVQSVIGEYVPSAKNHLVASFYDANGFTLVNVGPEGRRVYRRMLE